MQNDPSGVKRKQCKWTGKWKASKMLSRVGGDGGQSRTTAASCLTVLLEVAGFGNEARGYKLPEEYKETANCRAVCKITEGKQRIRGETEELYHDQG